MMSRRPINPSRRVADNGAASLEGSIRSKTRSPPYLTIGLVIVGAFLLIGYFYRDTGTFASIRGAISRVEDALDYLSPKYLNRTLPELARVSSDGLVIFTGYPRHHKAKFAEKSRFGGMAKLRSSTWWVRYFVQTSLEENEVAIKKFEQAALKKSYVPRCQIFHLRSYR